MGRLPKDTNARIDCNKTEQLLAVDTIPVGAVAIELDRSAGGLSLAYIHKGNFIQKAVQGGICPSKGEKMANTQQILSGISHRTVRYGLRNCTNKLISPVSF
jgi:hypothetical protein